MEEKDDIKFMRRCIELASKAEGLTYPNPLVGSVLTLGGKIIGEGYHLKSGQPHAEVNAINSVRDKSELGGATLYVNLEPCSHFGKTPPCADFIIASSIKKVVIGTCDTSTKVSGKGIDKLRSSGCEVTVGVLEEECRNLNRRFFTYHERQRPYITLKWAQSADGYLDIKRTDFHAVRPTWISGNPERVLVHKWRASEQAILVGGGTVRADNPGLNVREWTGNDPVKVILSSTANFGNAALFKPGGTVILFTRNMQTDVDATLVKLAEDKPAAVQIADYLYKTGIQSLFVEGGATVLNHFIANNMWDEARIFSGNSDFKDGVRSPDLNGMKVSKAAFRGSSLEIYTNDNRPIQ